MSFKDYNDLNEVQLDVLKEIGNIGSGNAATSLSCMLDKPVGIDVPTIKILDYDAVTTALGGPETMIVGLLLSLSGDITGMMMFLLPKDFAHMMLNALLDETFVDFEEVDELGISAMKEVANVMGASYVNAISLLTGLSVNISVPDICIDMAGAILSVPAIHYANISDKIIFIEGNFNSSDEKVSSQILMIPEVESLKTIMQKLGIEI